ncbi:MAG: hypothetical protein LBD66_00100 [Holosporales bacterium]|jgi:hypothetical protein|nr:hypothetical protein [Holosporales bacterium]
MYGADLQTTLEHFNDFLEKRRQYNPRIRVTIHWLQYTFNRDETEIAERYFTELVEGDLVFRGFDALINDLHGYLSYFRNKGKSLDGYNIEEAQKDMGFEEMDRCARARKVFPCFMKTPSFLVITEEGQMAQCCQITSKQVEWRMGDILTLNKEDYYKAQENSSDLSRV